MSYYKREHISRPPLFFKSNLKEMDINHLKDNFISFKGISATIHIMLLNQLINFLIANLKGNKYTWMISPSLFHEKQILWFLFKNPWKKRI